MKFFAGRTMIVARHEFRIAVMRWGFLATTLGMPLFMAALAILPAKNIEYISEVLLVPPDGDVIIVMDRAGVLTQEALDDAVEELGSRDYVAQAAELGEAAEAEAASVAGFFGHGIPMRLATMPLDELKAGVIDKTYAAGWILQPDYLETGVLNAFVLKRPGALGRPIPGNDEIVRAIRTSLVGEMPETALARVLEPSTAVNKESLGESGTDEMEGYGFGTQIVTLALPLVFGLLFSMSIFLASGFLLDGISEEKESRVIEVLLASVSPDELLNGKLIGLGAAGLLSLGIFLVMGLVPMFAFGVIQLGIFTAVSFMVFFFLGYALYASLLAAVGAVATTRLEGRQLSAAFTAMAVLPMLLLPRVLTGEPDPMMDILALLPPTAPVGMALQLAQGGVPFWRVGLSFTLLSISVILVMKGSARIFRVATLMTGKRPSIRQIIGFLRNPG